MNLEWMLDYVIIQKGHSQIYWNWSFGSISEGIEVRTYIVDYVFMSDIYELVDYFIYEEELNEIILCLMLKYDSNQTFLRPTVHIITRLIHPSIAMLYR